MAQVKLLKIASDGVPVEMNTSADDITLNSFTVQGGGPVLSGTGLDMNNLDITEVQDISFQAPSTATINQTAGNLIIDNIMAKERQNLMASTGGIVFQSISASTGSEVDSFKLPHSASAPSVSPSTNTDAGYMMAGNGRLYFWNGSAWDDYSVADEAARLVNSINAEGAIAANDCLYINSSGRVDLADCDVLASSQVCGFAKNSAAAQGDPVDVVSQGLLSGFSSLTVGSRYYLSGSAGQISSTVPSSSGQTIVQVGYAQSATQLMVLIQQLGRRA